MAATAPTPLTFSTQEAFHGAEYLRELEALSTNGGMAYRAYFAGNLLEMRIDVVSGMYSFLTLGTNSNSASNGQKVELQCELDYDATFDITREYISYWLGLKGLKDEPLEAVDDNVLLIEGEKFEITIDQNGYDKFVLWHKHWSLCGFGNTLQEATDNLHENAAILADAYLDVNPSKLTRHAKNFTNFLRRLQSNGRI